MKKKIITISRQFGSGGRTIGKQLADELGVKCYDREIIEKVAEKSGFAEEYIADRSEYGQRAAFSNFFADRSFGNGLSNEDQIWTIQSRFIQELAAKEECVIVGRCADYILKERNDVLRVFVHADLDKRAQRVVEVYGENPEVSTLKRLKQKDKKRATYYQFYTDMSFGDARNYHICLDSGELGIDTCVSIIKELALREY